MQVFFSVIKFWNGNFLYIDILYKNFDALNLYLMVYVRKTLLYIELASWLYYTSNNVCVFSFPMSINANWLPHSKGFLNQNSFWNNEVVQVFKGRLQRDKHLRIDLKARLFHDHSINGLANQKVD